MSRSKSRAKARRKKEATNKRYALPSTTAIHVKWHGKSLCGLALDQINSTHLGRLPKGSIICGDCWAAAWKLRQSSTLNTSHWNQVKIVTNDFIPDSTKDTHDES